MVSHHNSMKPYASMTGLNLIYWAMSYCENCGDLLLLPTPNMQTYGNVVCKLSVHNGQLMASNV